MMPWENLQEDIEAEFAELQDSAPQEGKTLELHHVIARKTEDTSRKPPKPKPPAKPRKQAKSKEEQAKVRRARRAKQKKEQSPAHVKRLAANKDWARKHPKKNRVTANGKTPACSATPKQTEREESK